MITLQQMIIFFIMIGVGVIARRRSIINEEGMKQISALVVNITTPAIILSAGVHADKSLSFDEFMFAFVLGCALFALLIFLAEISPFIFRLKKPDSRVLKLMIVFCNIMFMGLPLLSNIYGHRAVIYLMIFNLPSSLLIFTYGLIVVSGTPIKSFKNVLIKVFNPGLIAALLAFIFYFTNLKLPNIIVQPIDMVGSVTGPLAMILIGAAMANLKILDLFSDLKLVIFSLFKMFFMPLAIMLLLKQFITDIDLLGTSLILIATPAGNMIAMFATIYCPKANDIATRGISLTTLMSVVTLPLLAIITGIDN